ncbi:hypothetical protein K2X05_07360 [bacterium]|nr:hypothetical protein [bacterium]
MSLDKINSPFSEVTFLPLDINIDEHCSLVEAEIMRSYETLGFWSTYQGCWMLPLWTSGSGLKETELIEKSQPFSWTKAIGSLPSTRAMIERCIFPQVHGRYRVVALITPPGKKIKLHTDCNFEDISFLNHKLRFSIAGNISSLWFLNKKFEKTFVSSISRAYLLDGSHPHGVDASSSGFKITLCIGSPWSGDLTGDFLNLMLQSEKKFASHILWRSDLGRPIIRDIFIDKLREAEQAQLPDPRDRYISMIGR